MFNDLVWSKLPELIAEHAPATIGQRPGGLWLLKTSWRLLRTS